MMMTKSTPAVEMVGICKRYGGRFHRGFLALRNVDFTMERGCVLALIGPNGAGKTTLLRIISGMLRPTEGSLRVLGHDPTAEADQLRPKLGFLAAGTGLYGRLSGREVLDYFGCLYSIESDIRQRRIEQLIEDFQLSEFIDKPCEKLSTGMRQRINLARVFLHEPDFLILDEPTTGLDILSSLRIVKAIARQKEKGCTVILCTHHMNEVEALAERIVVLRDGEIAHDGPAGWRGENGVGFHEWLASFYPEVSSVD